MPEMTQLSSPAERNRHVVIPSGLCGSHHETAWALNQERGDLGDVDESLTVSGPYIPHV